MTFHKLMQALKERIEGNITLSTFRCVLLSFVPPEIAPPFIRVSFKESLEQVQTNIAYGELTLTLVTRFLGQKDQTMMMSALQKCLSSPLMLKTPEAQEEKIIFTLRLKNQALSYDKDLTTQLSQVVYEVRMKQQRNTQHV